jgi:hypothetical protein
MNVQKKNYLILLAACLVAGMTFSCKDLKDAFSSGINFTNAEEVQQLNEILHNAIPDDMVVHDISFSYSLSNSSFSFCKDEATVTYVDPDDKTLDHGLVINLKTGETKPDTWKEEHRSSIRRELKGVSVKDVDFSVIAGYVNKAIEQLNTEKNIQPNGLGSFRISFDSGKLDDYKYSFAIQHRTGSTRSGRTERISYDEYDFNVKQDGTFK